MKEENGGRVVEWLRGYVDESEGSRYLHLR